MAKKGGKRSGGGGGKQRKYTRDNNGRFASTGTGATARGGRLKTASGNKRKTQTAKMTGSKTASTVAKPKGLKPGTLKPKAATKAANKVVASPRRLNKDQKIARDVMTDKRFRSDKQRREEMIKRGIKPKTDIVALVATVRAKQGGATTARIKPASAAAKPAAPKAAKSSKSKMRTTKRTPLASDSSIAKRLAMFKSDKQLTDQRTKSLRAGLKKETNSVEKIKTSSAISESQLKSKSYNREITRMEARPIMGKRAGGRGDKPVSGPKAKRPNTIKGKPKRDAKVASKVKAKINLNAGRYKNIYINSANQKGKAAAKRKPRPMR